MSKIITRFAPSPTGKLHIGNIRTALINWLFAKKHGGQFILRMDDTDTVRSSKEYQELIKTDLVWLGLKWDDYFNQLSRIEKYEQAKQQLISQNRLYPCYETPEELDIKRKIQLSSGRPPIYDRSALKLTSEQIAAYEKQGRKPHYRFLIKDADIIWQDMIKGQIMYHGANLGDPVIIRADGSMTYMLCSTIDDIDYNITHIIRGEDHVSNTAIQIQMFEALSASSPSFGHLSLINAKDDKISKRVGGYDIAALRQNYIEPMTINSFLAMIGTSQPIRPYKDLNQLIESFDIGTYSKSPTTYMPRELEQLNQKIIATFEYQDIHQYLTEHNLLGIDEQFWLAVRPNLQKLSDLQEWWNICHTPPSKRIDLDRDILDAAVNSLPQTITTSTWSEWTKTISNETGKKGKDLFMTLRLAITGQQEGPELKNLLPLISRDELISRLISS